MNRILFLCLAVLLLSACDDAPLADPQTNTTLIWQGFYHDWSYNHRVNRMGDWIHDVVETEDGIKATLNHSAASGIGADVCKFSSFMTVMKHDARIVTAISEVDFVLQGVEGGLADTTISLVVELPGKDLTEASVLLNGFDLYARPRPSDGLAGDGAADKLYRLVIRPENVILTETPNGSLASFDLFAMMGADCTSPECTSGPIVDFFDYQFRVVLQVIAGPDELLAAHETTIDNNFSWDRPDAGQTNEIYREDYSLLGINIAGTPAMSHAVTGIRSIDFTAEKGFGGFDGTAFEHPHMLQFDLAVLNESYDAASGLMSLDADLFFKNWTAPIPPVSFGAGGAAAFEAGLVLLQFGDPGGVGGTDLFVREGSVTWNVNPFNPAPPTSGEAVSKWRRMFVTRDW